MGEAQSVEDLPTADLLDLLADEASENARRDGRATSPIRLAYHELGRRLGAYEPDCRCGRSMHPVFDDGSLEGYVCPVGHDVEYAREEPDDGR